MDNNHSPNAANRRQLPTSQRAVTLPRGAGMRMRLRRGLFVPALVLLVLCMAVPARPQGASRRKAGDVWGPRYKASSAQAARRRYP